MRRYTRRELDAPLKLYCQLSPALNAGLRATEVVFAMDRDGAEEAVEPSTTPKVPASAPTDEPGTLLKGTITDARCCALGIPCSTMSLAFCDSPSK